MRRLLLALLMGMVISSSSGCILKGMWCAIRNRCNPPGVGYCGGNVPCGGLCGGGWCCGGWGCEPFPDAKPDCCDPCDRCGNWVGPELYGDSCCGGCGGHGTVIHDSGYHHGGGCSSCDSHAVEMPYHGPAYSEPAMQQMPSASPPAAEPLPAPAASDDGQSRYQRRRRTTASYRHY